MGTIIIYSEVLLLIQLKSGGWGGGNCPPYPLGPTALNLILALHLAVNRTIEKIFVRVFYEPIVQIEDHPCAQIR